jgi:predicted nuclease of restriction endonuclease-like (RecB) superfamily
MNDLIGSQEYMSFLNDIKGDIQKSRVRAALCVNRELVHLYWRIGQEILERQKNMGWGSKVIEQLSLDLKHSFDNLKGFSKQNLWYMRQFAGEYSFEEILQQSIGEIPWGHNIEIFTKIKDKNLRSWYIQKTMDNGWSRNVLVIQIESQSHLKFGAAQTNFKSTLPPHTSDLAQQMIKNEYNFEFLDLAENVHERSLETALIQHIRDFLLELGNGFAFIGNQYKLEVGDEEFFVDLLFYHLKLRSYIVIELKTDKFKPEYAGQLGFYVTSVDRQLKHENDHPTIGILLCKKANKIVVEYALSDHQQPMGVAEYTTGLPKPYQNILPTSQQFQHLMNTLEKK